MRNFKLLNDLTGWALFLISSLVYILAIEPTASYWDAGEFIAVAYKLQVPHPPGAPLYLLIGRLFSMLAADVYTVAFWVNMVSALSSGFTIMFLYWSIVLLTRKIGKIEIGRETPYQTVTLIGSGMIGALAFAFSDSFWFSAEEAEVYAMSSFFMAIVVWAVLKWDLIKDPQLENKWLILIAYIMGLSIGVHLLNLVAFPSLALIYYFKKYPKVTTKGVIAALAGGLALVGIVMIGIIPGLPSVAGWFELLFVNSFGLPFGSGIIFFALIFLGALIYGIIYSHKKGKVLLNTALLCLTFVLIGYSSYAIIVIRSNANPPIDENNPENVISFVSYLKREQYGDRPLLYGHTFNSEVVDYEEGEPVYRKGEDEYEVAYHKQEYVYSDGNKMLLPRIYSIQPNHKQLYRERLGLGPNEAPSFFDNLEYMFSYQMGHMYWRYFMWNFAGRESDIKDAAWLSPADAFGEEELPYMLETNKARNNFLMLPLILGLIGAVFQYKRDVRGFSVVALLFFLTGLGLVLYLNSPPVEPRERDYIYVGSYYAFAFWIGFGVYAIAEGLVKVMKKRSALIPAIATAVCLLVPGIMAAEGWDDHDRSDRYFSVDSAKNFLASLAPNAILFTGGDNDTFPLWYAQEVEGFRTDVRVIVLTYFNTDWYIDQMTRQVYESEPLPFSLEEPNYRQGGLNDVIYYVENQNVKGALPLKQYIKLVKENHPAIRISNGGEEFNTIPSKVIALDVNKEEVLESGIIPESKEDLIVDKMVFQLKGNALYKNDLMILDLIATNDWERPIYFNNTSLQSINFDLTEYVIHEGTAYRLLPIRNPNPQAEMVNTEVMYDNMMNDFFWRELDNPDVYYNEDYRNFVLNHRSSFNTLAQALIEEGKTEKAREVLLYNLKVMPDAGVPFDYVTALTVQLLLQVGEQEKAIEIADLLSQRADELLAYLNEENTEIGNERQKNLIILSQLARSMAAAGLQEKALEYQTILGEHYGGLSASPGLR
ncbi:glycosyltransferase family 117 protein [Nafulsella turpanensis]|uniref:glycosyltransferase family 117 protein n=1 Tax=Nafulsella turpanensis TaxID=1265690 RepID=UPI000348FFFB|nr:DUF2723 domain-containing protein [Nafulsella turpanensis]